MKRPDGCNRHCCVSKTDKEQLQRETRCPALTNIFWLTRLIQCCDGPWPPAPLWCHCCWIRCHSRQVSSPLLQNIRLQKRGILSFLSLSHSMPKFIQCSAVNCYNHSQDGCWYISELKCVYTQDNTVLQSSSDVMLHIRTDTQRDFNVHVADISVWLCHHHLSSILLTAEWRQEALLTSQVKMGEDWSAGLKGHNQRR